MRVGCELLIGNPRDPNSVWREMPSSAVTDGSAPKSRELHVVKTCLLKQKTFHQSKDSFKSRCPFLQAQIWGVPPPWTSVSLAIPNWRNVGEKYASNDFAVKMGAMMGSSKHAESAETGCIGY